MTSVERLGEVIEASTTAWTSGAYRLLEAPAFGTLVRTSAHGSDIWIYGLVFDIRTGSREPGGRAMVRGGPRYDGTAFYDRAIFDEHPDLEAVLQTEWSTLVVGYARDGRIVHHLPPQPPTVHYSVHPCDEEAVRAFTARCDFFRIVLKTNLAPADDLLAAAIKRAAAVQPNPREYLLCAGQELARLLRDDYDRLRTIMAMVATL